MYKIIVYELIVFEVKQVNKTIKKRYFQKIKTLHNIDIKNLSKEFLQVKNKYKDFKYIISEIKENQNDWYIENLNKKSEKAYKEYILKGGF